MHSEYWRHTRHTVRFTLHLLQSVPSFFVRLEISNCTARNIADGAVFHPNDIEEVNGGKQPEVDPEDSGLDHKAKHEEAITALTPTKSECETLTPAALADFSKIEEVAVLDMKRVEIAKQQAVSSNPWRLKREP